MPLTLTQVYSTGRDSTAQGAIQYRNRVTAAAVRAAISISSEASNTPNHARRVALATSVIRDPDRYGEVFALAVATQLNALADAANDGTVESQVAAVWNAVAGQDAS